MKYFIKCIFFLVSTVESGRNMYNFFPNLPSGEFRIFSKAILFCNSNRDTDLQANFYLNKKNRNITELKGNVTFKIPFDDSLFFHVNFAVKDSIGRWQDNALTYKFPKVCSTIKHFMGIEWKRFLNNGGVFNTNCPISPGVYLMNGYDLTNLGSNFNITKIFFYGTYKVRMSVSDINKKYLGCINYVIEVKRPWETE